MSLLRRAIAVRKALNFISGEVSPCSSSGFRSLRILGGVSIPPPPPSRPDVFSRGFSGIPRRQPEVNDGQNWDSRNPPKEALLEGCDFKHWFIVMDPPEGNPTRDEIIDCYIKALTQVVGSEEEARRRIYSVSTKHYFAFGCQISEELSRKLEPIPNVRWVLPDSYFDIQAKSYGGEPFINGQAVPYDPKYHEEWVRNNARCNERRSKDRDRNVDRSKNFERRREMRQNAYQRPPPNSNYQGSGNTLQGAPNSHYLKPQGNTMQGAPNSHYIAPQENTRPPPNSNYQGSGNTLQGAPNSHYIAPQENSRPPPNSNYQGSGNTLQGAPNSHFIAPQENTRQGAPNSQG